MASGRCGPRAPREQELRPAVRHALLAAAAAPVVFVAGIGLLHGSLEAERSQKALVRDYERSRAGPQSRLVYFPQRPHSAEFYSRGTAQKAVDAGALRKHLDDAAPDFFAMRERDLAALGETDRARLQDVGAYGDYRLLRKAPR